jgi:hypothetical protein
LSLGGADRRFYAAPITQRDRPHDGCDEVRPSKVRLVRRSLHPGIQIVLTAAVFFVIEYPMALLIHESAPLIQVPVTAILFGVFFTLFMRFYMKRKGGGPPRSN